MLNKFAAVLLLFLATLTSPLLAQEAPCLNRTIAVNVLTNGRNRIEELSAQNFRGRIRGTTVDITSVAPDVAARRIAIVMDASASMRDVWRLEVEVAERLVNADASSAFALVIFGTQVESKIGFDQGRNEILDELARVKVLPRSHGDRQTALRDALAAALDLFHPAQFGDALYLISDGHDNASAVSGTQVTAAWNLSGVRLFALIPFEDPTRGRTAENDDGVRWLRGYVTASGGDSIIFRLGAPRLGFETKQFEAGKLTKPGEQLILAATSGFENEITRPYRLTVKLPEPLNKPRDWTLEVADSKGKINHNLRILYPQKLAPCP